MYEIDAISRIAPKMILRTLSTSCIKMPELYNDVLANRTTL